MLLTRNEYEDGVTPGVLIFMLIIAWTPVLAGVYNFCSGNSLIKKKKKRFITLLGCHQFLHFHSLNSLNLSLASLLSPIFFFFVYTTVNNWWDPKITWYGYLAEAESRLGDYIMLSGIWVCGGLFKTAIPWLFLPNLLPNSGGKNLGIIPL